MRNHFGAVLATAKGGRAVAVCIAVLVLGGCYRPQVIGGREASASLQGIDDQGWPRVKGLRLHVFNTGMNRVSPLLVGSPAPWRPAPAFVVEHPIEGLVVFDCGLGREIVRDGEGALHPITRLLFKARSAPGRELPDQMRLAGLSPDAVRTVIFSHLHFDHVGTAESFRNARFVAGLGARRAARSRMQGFEPLHTDWIDPSRWSEIDLAAEAPYATFDHGKDLFGDNSLIAVEGGGHNTGGLALFVNLPGGPVLLAGDTVVHFDWLASDDVQRIVENPERAADVRNMVRALLRVVPDLVLVPGHDLSGLPHGRDDLVLHDGGLFSAEAWVLD
ncbi:MAG: MBL fold metallo-hydrolase [Candidatus Binatia bacterium]